MNQEVEAYQNNLSPTEKEICDTLYHIINENLLQTEHKIWHAHPVWFLDGNPIVGYSKQKTGIRLMFWSGADFKEPQLNVLGKKFKDASLFYTNATEINETDLKRWLQKATSIQYDYKNIVKRKGVLVKL